MPVDKAWKKYSNKKFFGSYRDFEIAFMAGQKTISPEVWEVLSEIAGCDPDTWRDCWLYFNSKAKKLLEAGE